MNLYEEIVGRGGVSPSHFFYDMTLTEASAFMRGLQRKEQDEWERTRQLAYRIVQVNCTKELTPKEVMPFVWDKKEEVEVDETELERLRELSKKIKL